METKNDCKRDSGAKKMCSECGTEKLVEMFYTKDKCKICYNKKRREAAKQTGKRVCPGCKIEKQKDNYRRSQPVCKECEDNPDIIYDKFCKECEETKTNNDFQRNKLICNNCEKTRGRNYRRTTTKAAEWKANNPERMRELQHNHYENHKQEIRQKEKDRMANEPIFREIKFYRQTVQNLTHGINKTNKKMEIQRDFYLLWLETLYKDDMNIDNYVKAWQIDHIIPLNIYLKSKSENRFEEFEIDTDFSCLFCWFNTMPVRGDENMKKNKYINAGLILSHLKHLKLFLKENESLKRQVEKSGKITVYKKIAQILADKYPKSIVNLSEI